MIDMSKYFTTEIEIETINLDGSVVNRTEKVFTEMPSAAMAAKATVIYNSGGGHISHKEAAEIALKQ